MLSICRKKEEDEDRPQQEDGQMDRTHTRGEEQMKTMSSDGGEADVMSHDNLKYITKIHLLSDVCLPSLDTSVRYIMYSLLPVIIIFMML